MKTVFFAVLIFCFSGVAFAKPYLTLRQENIIRAMVESQMKEDRGAQYTDHDIEQAWRKVIKQAKSGVKSQKYQKRIEEKKVELDWRWIVYGSIMISYITVDSFCAQYDDTCRTAVSNDRFDEHQPDNLDEHAADEKMIAQLQELGFSESDFNFNH